MRGYIVLCLSAMAIAAPQGYNYNPAAAQPQGVQQSYSGHTGFNSVAAGSVAGGNGFHSAAHSVAQQNFHSQAPAVHQQAQLHQQQQQHQQQHLQQQQHQHQQQHQQPQPAIVSKRFFIHSAPEDHEEDYKEKHITIGVPKKNYNVVFIKAPAKSSKKTAIKISPAVNEEKTVIYVLSKKTDASDINAEVLEHPTSTTKPEVFFIKYKTNEEAAHAQEQIQSQYDSLGGSSQTTDEGVAPVTSVIGSLGDAASAGAALGGSSFNGAATHQLQGPVSAGSVNGGSHTNNGYLPPNFY